MVSIELPFKTVWSLGFIFSFYWDTITKEAFEFHSLFTTFELFLTSFISLSWSIVCHRHANLRVMVLGLRCIALETGFLTFIPYDRMTVPIMYGIHVVPYISAGIICRAA